MQQALDYAATLNIPFVSSSNGDGFVFYDRTGTSAQKEATLFLDAFPSPKTSAMGLSNAHFFAGRFR
jgi:type I restriction enzyme R subunit